MSGVINLAQLGFSKSRLLIYGRPGVGKTILSASSSTKRTFVMDVDDGSVSLACFPGINKQNVDIYPVKTYTDFQNACTYLFSNINRYGFYTIDSATELQRVLYDEIMEKGKKTIMDTQGWGILLTTMEKISRSFRQANIHGVWVCHEKLRENQLTGHQTFTPAFQGQFGEMYAKHFDVIMRLFLHESVVVDPATQLQSVQINHWLQCLPDATAEAKDRYSALSFYEQPSLDSIFQKIEAKISSENS